MKGIVYVLKFSDGKFYIGSTVETIAGRMRNHRHDCKRRATGFLYKHWRHLNEEPNAEILDTVDLETKEDLRTIERHWLEPFLEDVDCLNCYKPRLTDNERREYNAFNALRWRLNKKQTLLQK